jgi:hypothetical protein
MMIGADDTRANAREDSYSAARPHPRDSEMGFYPRGISVDVRSLDSKLWQVLAPFEYRAARRTFVIEAGVTTDFASIPRPFVWLIPTYGLYTRAAILHDVLCDQGLERNVSRRDADGIFLQALRILGVPFLQRWLMWTGVRLGALKTAHTRKDWSKDASRVLTIVLAVTPLLLAPAVLIVVVLYIWKALERIAWWGLRFGRPGKAGAPRKQLNHPHVDLTA